ncbi:MAG: alpha/beta hydrolase [Bdellovibrionales bacterium]|nr:alpha/beta hydrolase [Bdellovibrionales bacterium]
MKQSTELTLDNWNYKIIGKKSAPKIVFLHGIMGSLSNWLKVSAYFKSNFEILLFDQRGHGRSFHGNSYKLADYAKDLEFITNKIGWDKFHLVGHSSGGVVACEYSATYPNKILSLCIEDVSMEPSKNIGKRIEKILLSIPTPFKDKLSYEKFFTEKVPSLTENFFQSKFLERFLAMNITEDKNGEKNWRFHRDGIIESVRESRAVSLYPKYFNISCPILIIRGSKSEHLPPEEYKKMLTHKNAQGVEFLSGHAVHIEQCEGFSKALLDFINGLC